MEGTASILNKQSQTVNKGVLQIGGWVSHKKQLVRKCQLKTWLNITETE